jgi:hypothetical protein
MRFERPAAVQAVSQARRKDLIALNGQLKRAAEVVLLLKRFDLLPAGTGRRSEWVKRRHRLDVRDLKDRFSEL